MEVVPLWISFQRDPQWPSGGITDIVEPERPTGRRVPQRSHDGVPGFAVGVAAEQQDLIDHIAAGADLLPEGSVLAEFHVVRRRVPDDRTMLVVRTLGVVAMRKVRGRKEDVSRATAVPPNYETLKNGRRSEPVCSKGQYPPGKLWQLPRTRKASWHCVRDKV